MWSRVARLASPAQRRQATPEGNARAGDDTPRLVAQLEAILADPLTASPSLFASLLSQLLSALRAGAAEAAVAGLLPEGLEHLLREGSLGRLVDLVEHDARLRQELVRWYGNAIVDLEEEWLSHSAVNRPLVRLLRRCVDEDGDLQGPDELAVVRVMCTICERIKTRPELLAIFFHEKTPRPGRKDAAVHRPDSLSTISDAPASPTLSQATVSDASAPFSTSYTSTASPRRRAEHDFLLFAYLLRFIHREGELGDLAREGVLALVDVALGYPAPYSPSGPSFSRSSSISPAFAARDAVLAFAEYLHDSDLAEVLGAGLGALYGLLPTKLVARAETVSANATGTGDASISGGMVLGGMGALYEDGSDAEAIAGRLYEEETRLRAEGYGITGTPDFRESLDGFLKLVEFTRDVLRRCTDGLAVSEDDDADERRQQYLIMSALTSTILSAVRDLFLQSVLYPSILECSETDGSAVAVLTYLDALLGVLPEGSRLEATVLGYLFAEEGPSEQAAPSARRPRLPHASSATSPPSRTSQVKRHKSSALLLVERAAPAFDGRGAGYYTSLGRFTLRDVLVSNIPSTSAPTSAAALKLLRALLVHHDRWSVALLDPILDEAATSFPFVLRAQPHSLDSDDDDSDEDGPLGPSRPARHNSDEDSDHFVYPTGDKPSTPRVAHSSALAKTPSNARRPLLGLPLPSTPSAALHLDLLDTMLSLVGRIDPIYRQMRSVGGGSEMVTTGFANYLRDAEASLASDLGFRRGLRASPADAREAARPPTGPRRRSTLFGSTKVTVPAREFATAKTGYRHGLRPDAELVALLLASFGSFFSHSPDVNLALTGALAALALSPYRSLEGWLLPAVRQRRPAQSRTSARPGQRDTRSPKSDDGDDRSDDFEIDEQSRHAALLPAHPESPFAISSESNAPPSATRAALATSNSLLSVLHALAGSIEQYRRDIPRFDVYLAERRKGLFFAENLAEALEGDELVGALEEIAYGPSRPEPSLSPPIAELAPKKSPAFSGLGGFFSPRRPSAAHRRTPSTPPSAFLTPTRSQAPPASQLRRSASDDFLTPLPESPSPLPHTEPAPRRPPVAATGQGAGPVSPFAAHYRETGAIVITPIVVTTPAAVFRDDGDACEAPEGTGPPDSPTRRLSSKPGAARSTSPSAQSSASTSFSTAQRSRKAAPTHNAQRVSLSTILDNVIVLEEFVKEITAIVFVRRSVGIDTVRFIESFV